MSGGQENVTPSDRWRTPVGVIAGALALLRRAAFDLDAAAEEGASWAPVFINADEDALKTPWGPKIPRWRPWMRTVTRPWELPCVWQNSPFSQNGGGKEAWADRAIEQAETGLLVAVYFPGYADKAVAQLDGLALARMTVVGRVAHVPPDGLDAGSPDRHVHQVHVFGTKGCQWPGPQLCAWDWRERRWIGRAPQPLGSERKRTLARLGPGLLEAALTDPEAARLGFRRVAAMGLPGLAEALAPVWETCPADQLVELAQMFNPTKVWSSL